MDKHGFKILYSIVPDTGTRLGLCWVMLEERYEEFRGQVTTNTDWMTDSREQCRKFFYGVNTSREQR
jgi:hypothetical protein